jgi:hypothetical protein
MSQKKIVLRTEGLKLEFEDSYWGWQHLLDYVSREMKERTPKHVRTATFASVETKKQKVRV